jgi:hypothetical protein
VNPLDELTDLAIAQQDLIDKLDVEKARLHVEWAQAQHELALAKQRYLRILKPRLVFIGDRLKKDPNWTAPSDATREAHLRAIATRRDDVAASSAAEAAADTALADAHTRLSEMRAAWPAALGPFPVPQVDTPAAEA